MRSDLGHDFAQVAETTIQAELGAAETRFRQWAAAFDERMAANPNFADPIQPGTAVAASVQEVLVAAGDWEGAGRFFANKLLARIWDLSLPRWVRVCCMYCR